MGKNIGFISTRFSGTDGVSLEANKWAHVFEEAGHRCYWFAGKLDRDPDRSYCVPEAYFQHKKNCWINNRVFGIRGRRSQITDLIHGLRSFLKKQLHCFIEQFNIDLLIAENALTIPVHIPLGLSLAEVIAETDMPAIAHHHDFYWERSRFAINAVNDYLRMAFPPNLPNIKHVVINSEAQEQLALRAGISSQIIPNVLDYENPPVIDIKATQKFRKSIGLTPDDIMILQPTRVIRRKGIEQAIELVKELNDNRCKLIISHEAGDEGFEYANWLKEYALEHKVDLRMVQARLKDPWLENGKYSSGYSLWDIYPHADFVTFPSLSEGFGNAFLEAIYFKKPLLTNRYSTFIKDIEPKGFDLPVMDGFLSRKTVKIVKEILENPERRRKMVNYNYEVAARHYSYAILRNQFSGFINELFDESGHKPYIQPSDTGHVIYLKIDPSGGDYYPSNYNIERDWVEN